MKLRLPQSTTLIFLAGLIILSACSKDDPKPLGAQTNAALLAGDKGKSKSWKLISWTGQQGTGAAQTFTLDPCFSDNLYTFSNNDAQDYVSTEGATTCGTGAPATIEAGTWSFTLDGLLINIGVDETYSTNGLFSPEAIGGTNSNGQAVAFNIGVPFPASVTSLTATSMVLEINETIGSSKYRYVLTFTAI